MYLAPSIQQSISLIDNVPWHALALSPKTHSTRKQREVKSMYRMEKITTGAAYGASAGSILNGMLNAYSPEQWNAIGVLVGIVIAVLTYLTNLYFKIREDNRRNRSHHEPDTQE
jgi:mannitol-specific phosphotransferase system IIBC component